MKRTPSNTLTLMIGVSLEDKMVNAEEIQSVQSADRGTGNLQPSENGLANEADNAGMCTICKSFDPLTEKLSIT